MEAASYSVSMVTQQVHKTFVRCLRERDILGLYWVQLKIRLNPMQIIIKQVLIPCISSNALVGNFTFRKRVFSLFIYFFFF